MGDNADSWFEKWIEQHEIHDKDSDRLNKKYDIIFQPFKEASSDFKVDVTHKKTKKFFIEEENSIDKWLAKNEVFDKDNSLKEKEIWMYPPENLYSVRIEATIDLHTLTVSQALGILHQFILTCFNQNDRVVKVIHGKGNHSRTVPKVKIAVLKWLRTEGKAFVRFFKEADARRGGGGATLVWLK